jgi:Tfp pilus assembly protein PilX
MKTLTLHRSRQTPAIRQHGVVLFFALIALLAMSLAAVALIRSVDTGTIIAGNLALKQSATVSSDAGVEAASAQLVAMNAASVGMTAMTDAAHPFNNDAPASGYYASVDPTVDPITGITWTNAFSAAVNPDPITQEPTPDASGNATRYVIHRMCRDSGVAIKDTNCLFAAPPANTNEVGVSGYGSYCKDCGSSSATPQLRVTTRTTGPRGTISYVQVFIF